MNKILTILLITLFSTTNYSQKSFVKLPFTNNICSTIIIGKDIIANKKYIEGIKKEFVIEMKVMIDEPNRKKHQFFNLTENGIIFFNLNTKTTFKTQSQLNTFFENKKNNEVYVNGYLLENSDFKIATESIVEIDLVEPNSKNKLRNRVINVWTLTKKERLHGYETN